MVQKTRERWRGDSWRNALLILMMSRHGLRTSEAAQLRWDQVSLDNRQICVERINGGIRLVHALSVMEIEYLGRIKPNKFSFFLGRQNEAIYIFEGPGEKPLTPRAIGYIISTAGEAASIGFPVHPHMLRHTCGYYLANHFNDPVAVQKYLGLKNRQNAMRYFKTEIIEFQNIWNDWAAL